MIFILRIKACSQVYITIKVGLVRSPDWPELVHSRRRERSYELYDAAHSVAVDATRFTPRHKAACCTVVKYVPMYAYKRNYMLYDLAMGASALNTSQLRIMSSASNFLLERERASTKRVT